MIVLAVVFLIMMAAEMNFLKKKKQSIKPYFIITAVLFILCEVMFYFRDTFQIAMLVQMMQK